MTSVSSNSMKLFNNAGLDNLMKASGSGIVGTSAENGVKARSSFFSGLANIVSAFSPSLQQANKDAKLNFMTALKTEFKLDESTLMKFEKKIDVESGKPLKMSQAQKLITEAFVQTERAKAGVEIDEIPQDAPKVSGGKHNYVELEDFGEQISYTSRKIEEFAKPTTSSQSKQVEDFNKDQILRGLQLTIDDDDFEEDIKAIGPGAMRNQLAEMKEKGASMRELGEAVVTWMKLKGTPIEDIYANFRQTMTDFGIDIETPKETGELNPHVDLEELAIVLTGFNESESTIAKESNETQGEVAPNFEELIYGKPGLDSNDELTSILDEILLSTKDSEPYEEVVERLINQQYEEGRAETKIETEKKNAEQEVKGKHHHHGGSEEMTILEELQSQGVFTDTSKSTAPQQSVKERPAVDPQLIAERNQHILDLVNKSK